MSRYIVNYFIILIGLTKSNNEDIRCHDDPAFNPTEDGPVSSLQFTWLGALQYIHVKNATPHYFRAPRVLLISKRYALCTAKDATDIPKGYALGNIIFGEYERDEVECKLTIEDLASGKECNPAVLLMPIMDVMVHPDAKYKKASSVAMLKMLMNIRSNYMVPVCLPYKDYLQSTRDKPSRKRLYHIDFPTNVPRDFIAEDKEIHKIQQYPDEVCTDMNSTKASDKLNIGVVCSSGCGFTAGSPVVVHEKTGHWTVVALAEGGSICPDPLIGASVDIRPPPRLIPIFPYLGWIGHRVNLRTEDFSNPFDIEVARTIHYDPGSNGWVGHWWLGGFRCFNRGQAARTLYRFYADDLTVQPSKNVNLTYYLQIVSAHKTIIVCVKVGMPFQIGKPRIWGIESDTVSLRIPLIPLDHFSRVNVEAWGHEELEYEGDGDTNYEEYDV